MVLVVYVGRTLDTGEIRLLQREELILLEIGNDRIDSASAFVDYMHESYGFSKSSVWYNLNRLKEKGILDFASRDSPGKSLELTGMGRASLPIVAQERRYLMTAYSSGDVMLNR